jgi:RNA polymerase sigma-70 factor (ECF subfamily)
MMDISLSTSSEALMLDYAKGNAAAFSQLYALHKGPLFRFILRQGMQNGQADEVFQEIWLKVIKARESYQSSARFQTWLYSIARNHLIDEFRKKASSNTVEDSLDYDSKKQQLLTKVEALPFEQREAFLLKHEAGMNNEDIAIVTGTNPETAKSRVRYAINQLKKQLGGSQ